MSILLGKGHFVEIVKYDGGNTERWMARLMIHDQWYSAAGFPNKSLAFAWAERSINDVRAAA